MSGLWIPTADHRPAECRCIWTNYGDQVAGWWRQYTPDNGPIHGVEEEGTDTR